MGGSRPRYAATCIARAIQRSPSHPRFRRAAVLAAWQKARRRLPDSRRLHRGRRARARGYRTARSSRRRHQHTIAGRCCAQSGIFGGKRHVSKRMDALAGRIRGTKGQRARDRRNRSRQNHAAQSNAYAMRAGGARHHRGGGARTWHAQPCQPRVAGDARRQHGRQRRHRAVAADMRDVAYAAGPHYCGRSPRSRGTGYAAGYYMYYITIIYITYIRMENID